MDYEIPNISLYISLRLRRHRIFLALLSVVLNYIYDYFRSLISQSINFHIRLYVKCQSRKSRATFLYLVIQNCSRCNKSSCNKNTIFLQLEEDQQSLQHESARRGPSANVVDLPSSGISEHTEWRWARSTKASIPTRSYFKEIATTIFIPVALLLVLGALLSTAFCLHHEKM